MFLFHKPRLYQYAAVIGSRNSGATCDFGNLVSGLIGYYQLNERGAYERQGFVDYVP